MIDSEAIARIEKLVHEVRPIIEAPDYKDTGRFYIRQADGALVEQHADREPDGARVYDTDSLAALVAEVQNLEDLATVYYGPQRITAVITNADDSWRRREYRMALERHPSFKRLAQLLTTQTFDQRGLIRLLRAEFNGHVEDAVVEQFRSLRLSTTGKGESVLAKGREAVDRSIANEVTAAQGQQIPDEIEVTIPVFDLDESRETLMEVGVLVEARQDEDGRPVFELTTVLNDLRGAERAALDGLVGLLRGKLPAGVALLYGEPS